MIALGAHPRILLEIRYHTARLLQAEMALAGHPPEVIEVWTYFVADYLDTCH